MTEIITWITQNASALVEIVAYIVMVASGIAALTPTPKDDTIVAKIQGVVKKVADYLALNVMNAKK